MRSPNRDGKHADAQRRPARRGTQVRRRTRPRVARNPRLHPATVILLATAITVTPAHGLDAPPAFRACTDFHCDVTAPATLSAEQWRRVRDLFEQDTSPARERAAIRRAIALLEELTGSQIGTWRDRGGNFFTGSRSGQLDCIAESRNTDTFLHLMENAGLLRWHSVEPRVMRRRWLVSEHWTAVIRERASGSDFAVDSWYRDNGEPPCIQPLADWRAGRYPAVCADGEADHRPGSRDL